MAADPLLGTLIRKNNHRAGCVNTSLSFSITGCAGLDFTAGVAGRYKGPFCPQPAKARPAPSAVRSTTPCADFRKVPRILWVLIMMAL
jgi:hypothetical protein